MSSDISTISVLSQEDLARAKSSQKYKSILQCILKLYDSCEFREKYACYIRIERSEAGRFVYRVQVRDEDLFEDNDYIWEGCADTFMKDPHKYFTWAEDGLFKDEVLKYTAGDGLVKIFIASTLSKDDASGGCVQFPPGLRQEITTFAALPETDRRRILLGLKPLPEKFPIISSWCHQGKPHGARVQIVMKSGICLGFRGSMYLSQNPYFSIMPMLTLDAGPT